MRASGCVQTPPGASRVLLCLWCPEQALQHHAHTRPGLVSQHHFVACWGGAARGQGLEAAHWPCLPAAVRAVSPFPPGISRPYVGGSRPLPCLSCSRSRGDPGAMQHAARTAMPHSMAASLQPRKLRQTSPSSPAAHRSCPAQLVLELGADGTQRTVPHIEKLMPRGTSSKP